MTTVNYGPLWYWATAREAIRVRKEAGVPPPWTADPVLSEWRFCNVRREDDRVTRWVHDHVRVPYEGHPKLWWMLAACRMIGWPPTIAELIATNNWPSDRYFQQRLRTGQVAHVLEARAARGEKVFTGAYVVPGGPRGSVKARYVVDEVLGKPWQFQVGVESFLDSDHRTLKGYYDALRQFAGWGPFLAYQAVVDLRFTPVLADAPDVATWAAAGPGTIRGLNRLYGREVGASLSQRQALDEMLEIYRIAEAKTGVAMDLSDVPNICCEYDKWDRVRNGEGKPRARYVFGRSY